MTKCLNCNDDFVPKQKFCCDNCRKRYFDKKGRSSPKQEEGQDSPKENTGLNRPPIEKKFDMHWCSKHDVMKGTCGCK